MTSTGQRGKPGTMNRPFSAAIAILLAATLCQAQTKRKVIIDQDAMGPAGTDQNSMLVLIQSPDVDPLGITVVTGDGWRDEEVAHTLRMLEIVGRTDISVHPGAIFPLVNSKAGIEQWEKLYGRVRYMGAWFVDHPQWKYHDPFVVPELKEGSPKTKPSSEDAAHFMARMVRQYPHEVTIYAAGPLTNLALAMELDPEFPELASELVLMGGSMNPVSNNPEYLHSPQREFNFWFDPEATHKVLHGRWPKITCTTVDISVKTHESKEMIDEIAKVQTPLAQYVSKYTHPGQYMWDELAAAAWVDPSIITKEETVYMDADVDHGAGYGNTLSWAPEDHPGVGEDSVHVLRDIDTAKLYGMFVRLMTSPTPPAHPTSSDQKLGGSSGEFSYYDQPEFKPGTVDAASNIGGYSSAAAPDAYDLILAFIQNDGPSRPPPETQAAGALSAKDADLPKGDDWTESQFLSRGSDLLLHQQSASALEVFRRAVQRFPDSTKLQTGFGVALFARGEYDQAVTALIRATDLMPSDPRPYLLLGKAYQAARLENDEAVGRLKRLVELDPHVAQASYYYALGLRKGGKPADSPRIESLLKRAIDINPEFTDAHLQLGALYADEASFPPAIEQYKEAIRLRPDFAAAHYRLAQVYLRAGYKHDSEAELAAYNRLRPSDHNAGRN